MKLLLTTGNGGRGWGGCEGTPIPRSQSWSEVRAEDLLPSRSRLSSRDHRNRPSWCSTISARDDLHHPVALAPVRMCVKTLPRSARDHVDNYVHLHHSHSTCDSTTFSASDNKSHSHPSVTL